MSRILRLHQRVVVKRGTYSPGGEEKEEGLGEEEKGTYSPGAGLGEGLGMLGTLMGTRHLRSVQEL